MVATGRRLTAAASVEFEAVSLVSGSFSSTVAAGWVEDAPAAIGGGAVKSTNHSSTAGACPAAAVTAAYSAPASGPPGVLTPNRGHASPATVIDAFSTTQSLLCPQAVHTTAAITEMSRNRNARISSSIPDPAPGGHLLPELARCPLSAPFSRRAPTPRPPCRTRRLPSRT